MRNHIFRFWQQQQADETGMILNTDVPHLASADRTEILNLLPFFTQKRILELGAGIGRFTTAFIKEASRVVAVDYQKTFLQKNCERNQNCNILMYLCAAAQNLEFKPNSFDMVFTNWLFMYLEDNEVSNLIHNIHKWLDNGGIFFIRESCKVTSTNKKPEPTNPTHYREPEFYLDLLQKYFCIKRSGYVDVYYRLYNNQYQLFWICEKASP